MDGTRVVEDGSAGQVAGHDHHGVAEVHRAALGVGESAIIEHLEQQVEHLGVGLLHLIQQHHGIGPTPHRLGELAALLVAHIAGRCPHQPGHGIALHVFAHVETHQGVFLIKEGASQGLRQLGFADSRRTQKQKGPHGPARRLHPRPGPPNRSCHGSHRLRLANHPLCELGFELQQLLPLTSQQPLHRNARPAGHHIGDITSFHLLPQQGFAALLISSQLRLQGIATLLQAMQLVVLELGRLLQIAFPLSLCDGMAQVFVLLQQTAQLSQAVPLHLPAGLQLVQGIGGPTTLLLELHPFGFRGRLRR